MNEKAINSKGNLLKMKESFMTGIKNKDFLLFLVILLVKSLAFIILISDDKANRYKPYILFNATVFSMDNSANSLYFYCIII